MARPDPVTAPPAATGIDYLTLIEARHAAELATGIGYAQLPLLHDQPPTPPARPEETS